MWCPLGVGIWTNENLASEFLAQLVGKESWFLDDFRCFDYFRREWERSSWVRRVWQPVQGSDLLFVDPSTARGVDRHSTITPSPWPWWHCNRVGRGISKRVSYFISPISQFRPSMSCFGASLAAETYGHWYCTSNATVGYCRCAISLSDSGDLWRWCRAVGWYNIVLPTTAIQLCSDGYPDRYQFRCWINNEWQNSYEHSRYGDSCIM